MSSTALSPLIRLVVFLMILGVFTPLSATALQDKGEPKKGDATEEKTDAKKTGDGAPKLEPGIKIQPEMVEMELKSAAPVEIPGLPEPYVPPVEMPELPSIPMPDIAPKPPQPQKPEILIDTEMVEMELKSSSPVDIPSAPEPYVPPVVMPEIPVIPEPVLTPELTKDMSLPIDPVAPAEDPDTAPENELQILPQGTPFRPARQTPKPVVSGVQTARVEGVDNSDADAEDRGRYFERVEFTALAGRTAVNRKFVGDIEEIIIFGVNRREIARAVPVQPGSEEAKPGPGRVTIVPDGIYVDIIDPRVPIQYPPIRLPKIIDTETPKFGPCPPGWTPGAASAGETCEGIDDDCDDCDDGFSDGSGGDDEAYGDEDIDGHQGGSNVPPGKYDEADDELRRDIEDEVQRRQDADEILHWVIQPTTPAEGAAGDWQAGAVWRMDMVGTRGTVRIERSADPSSAPPGFLWPSDGMTDIKNRRLRETFNVPIGVTNPSASPADHRITFGDTAVDPVAVRPDQVAVSGTGVGTPTGPNTPINITGPDGSSVGGDVPTWGYEISIEPVTEVGFWYPIYLQVTGLHPGETVVFEFLPGAAQTIQPLEVTIAAGQAEAPTPVAQFQTTEVGPQAINIRVVKEP